jgi:outer membrane protein assembly factor BamA
LRIKLFILFLVLFKTLNIYSQENKDTVKMSPIGIGVSISESDANKKLDSLNQKNFGLIAYPFAFYSPETQLAFGAGGMVYFRLGILKDIRLSKVSLSAYYTTNKQYNFSIAPKLYFPGVKQVYLDGSINFAQEEGKFFGAGNNTYETDSSSFKSHIFHLNAEITGLVLFKSIHTGLIYDYTNNRVIDNINNPFLNNTNTRGLGESRAGGLGAGLLMDTRDNISFPESGSYAKFNMVFYRKFFGSSFIFDKFTIDLRHFWMPIKSHILAFQYLSEFTNGDVPFYSLPAIGGSSNMRGYYEGRYRDKQYITTQAEYRKILFWRLGVAAFYSVGQVSDKIGNFRLNDFKHTYGAGLRFVFDKKEKINLRVDLGVANGKTGVYFNLDEAF